MRVFSATVQTRGNTARQGENVTPWSSRGNIMAKGLTVFAIKAAKAKARTTGRRVPKKDGRALFYVAFPTGGESWVQYFRVRGSKELAKITLKEPGTGIAGARRWGSEIREKAAR